MKLKGKKNRKEVTAVKSRKEIRKQNRKDKKAKKNAFFQRKNTRSDMLIVPDMNVKKCSTLQHVESDKVIHKVHLVEQQQQVVKDKKKQQEERRKQQYKKKRVQQLKAANEEEDRVIKKLEKQLKLNKRKQKTVPKSFTCDGLDYLLEVCDEEGRQSAISAEKSFLENSDSEFEEDLALVTGKVAKRTKSESFSNISEVVHNSVNSDCSDVNSKSEDDSDGEEDNDTELSGDDFNIGFDSDEHLNYDPLISENVERNELVNCEKKEVRKNKKIEIDNGKNSKTVKCSVGGEVDNTAVVVWKKKEKKNISKQESNKSKNNTCSPSNKNVDGRERSVVFEDNEQSCLSDDDSEDQNRQKKRKKTKICGQEKNKCKNKDVSKKKKSVQFEDDEVSELCENSEDEGKQKKKKNKISGRENIRSNNITHTSLSKEVGKKNKCMAFKDESSGFSKDSENEGVDHDSGEEIWEDIYGRTRDRKGNIVQVESQGKYIPPHLRVQISDKDAKKQEQLLRLKKQIKGLLNRLAESNMNSIAVQMDELYMCNSRNDMNETLTQLVLESLIAPVLTPERLVMEQIMLVAILHANVGSEVGAHFMQVLIKKFELLSSQCQEVKDKELDNVVLTLSHLYNFRVFHCILMFDILERLVDKFGEKEIELILIVLRSVGFSLRKDDPAALKDFILRVQHKASVNTHNDSSRVNFMLDILLAIKNNNMSKIPNYDTSHSEHLKKLLKGFLRKGNYVTELKISLDDLLKVEERGRWWVVGSAWTGLLPGELQTEGTKNESVTAHSSTQYSKQLLELARKQRMNTDVRRNIFCILMTAEDYLDAFEKLLRMGLKNQQEREVIYVILHCCLQEKKFNPYYGFLAQKFCDFDRKYQITLQFTLWDMFKEMPTFNQQQTTNLAKLLAYLLLERGLPISVLKVVEFVNVDKKMVRFLRQALLGVLLSTSEEASLQVFQRVVQSAKLRMFCESLRLFIHHFLLRNTTALPEADAQLLTHRAKLADTLLTASDHKLNIYSGFQ